MFLRLSFSMHLKIRIFFDTRVRQVKRKTILKGVVVQK